MSEKYVIKNCLCYRDYKEYKEAGLLPPAEKPYCYNKADYCQNISDCVMKKIYEKVKECQCSELMNGYFDIEECK